MMTLELTEQEQAVRVAGMETFALQVLAEQVFQTLRSMHRSLKGHVGIWRNKLLTATTPLKLIALIEEVNQQVEAISGSGTRYAGVKLLTPETATAVSGRLGYDTAFLGVAIKIIDEALLQLSTLDETTTAGEFTSVLDWIDANFSEEPQL